MPLQLPHPPTNPRHLNSRIWRACAGNSIQIPAVHSRVYYFPEGHVEQFSSHPTFLPSLVLPRPAVLCRISTVDFRADPITDEVYAKLVLQPTNSQHPSQFLEPSRNQSDRNNAAGENDKIISFSKTLTPSDANNGGGFSVPRFCTDSIFSPLNYHAELPVQTLSVADVHGAVWDFRHIKDKKICFELPLVEKHKIL